MRNIRKVIKAYDVQVYLYDRNRKEERVEVYTISEISPKPILPENCVIIEMNAIPETEREMLYIMSPQEFVKHAKMVELSSDTEPEQGEAE